MSKKTAPATKLHDNGLRTVVGQEPPANVPREPNLDRPVDGETPPASDQQAATNDQN